MTRYDAIRRQLGDIEKNHERALEKRDMQVRVMAAYRDELEDKLGIAARLLTSRDCSIDDALKSIDDEYERRQAKRKVAVDESVSSECLAGDALANAALAHIVSEYGLKQPQDEAS